MTRDPDLLPGMMLAFSPLPKEVMAYAALPWHCPACRKTIYTDAVILHTEWERQTTKAQRFELQYSRIAHANEGLFETTRRHLESRCSWVPKGVDDSEGL